MPTYRISGVWKNSKDTITHYGIHKKNTDSLGRAMKYTKLQAVKLVETTGNSVSTQIWNYKSASWNIGEKVEVVNGSNGKYLRSNPDKKETNNLGHLIDYDWLSKSCFH